jgi:rhamnulokinase
MKNEYTIASTTAMVNAETKTWDKEIAERIGVDPSLFLPLALPGDEIGAFSAEIAERVGFNACVVAAPSHDTASAVAACPIDGKCAYISSGTWSLFGTENTFPVTSDAARAANFSNEGGVEHRFRFLKNIMGMWLFQNVRRNLDKKYSYDEMMNMAEKCEDITYIDVNDSRIKAPKSMIEAVRSVANKPDMPLDAVINCVYHSLARSYSFALGEIERLTGKTIESISIVGGGSADGYLNRLTAKYTGKRVFAGPREATALGNIISQMISSGELTDIKSARECVKKSFGIEEIR